MQTDTAYETVPISATPAPALAPARLTRDSILSAVDLSTEVVSVPEWGGSVCVRGLTGAERDGFELTMFEASKTKKSPNIRASLVARTACDEHGNRLFTDADVEALGRKSSAPLDRLFEVASRLSGISKKDVEDLEKN